ncbi:MAG: transposase, partial [Candidatus Omnitrophica bacterium]|nr:transposase [Candidatus Omnitrophota bacterium]
MKPITRIPNIPEDQITPLVAELLGTIQLQMEEIQLLKDEIARLKGQKPKPDIKPSNLEKKTKKKKSSNKKPRSRKKAKTKKLEINEDIPLKPENLPPGSRLKDYQDYVVQDIILANWNIRYRRQRWETPSGDFVIAELPEDVNGHFGSTLVSFILYQHYGCCVTQPLILEQLRELGVDISSGQVSNIIIKNKERFHSEKDLILSTGLQISKYINVDDTGARHKGQNGYCTHIGNEYFAWFESTPKKNR